MRLRPATRLPLLAIVALAGCGAESSAGDGALGAVSDEPPPTPTAPDTTEIATELAPSQIVGSTVPVPDKPVPCVLDDLELWTAQVIPGVSTVDSVIRIRNAGDVRCDADIGRSQQLDPAIEFDVWLDAGQTADLFVGQMTPECVDPSVVSAIDVTIGEEVAAVPTLVVTCSWWMNAFYPNDPIRAACDVDALELAVTPAALLVRNGSFQPCGLGGVVEVDGATLADDRVPGPSIMELMAGDVVAFGRRSDVPCDGPIPQVTLVDEGVGELVFDAVPCELVFEFGGGRPWLDAAVIDGVSNASDVADALNVFGDGT